MKSRKSKRFIGVFILACLVGMVFPVMAQRGESGWDTPLNLSQSGGADTPSVAVDGAGISHIFWADEISGYIYRSGEIDALSEPQVVRVPFTFPRFLLPTQLDIGDEYLFYEPQFVFSGEQFHTFWLDADGAIRYSRVLPENMANGQEGWSETFFLADENVIALQSAVDENGRLHLLYIQTTTSDILQPGLYHRASDDGGVNWTDPALLYASNYYRETDPDETQITVQTAGSSIFVTWDDRTLEQLFFIASEDGGETWDERQIIERREPTDPSESLSSSNLTVLAISEDDIHLSWLAGDPDDFTRCHVLHQYSENGGNSWSEINTVYASSGGTCPAAPKLLEAQTGLIVIMNVDDGVGYLQAWDGTQWTEPDPQLYLGTLQDPLTFRDVELGCYKVFVTAENELRVIACGSGNDRDIWLLQRPLGELSDWFRLFEATPVWSAPVSLISSQVYLLPGDVVAGADGRLHTFWSQSDDVVAVRRLEEITTEVGPDIYYARLNGGEWGAPRPILSSPIGKADQLAAAANDRGQLFIVWSSGKDGGIYMSRSNAERASSATEWIDPILLPAPQTTGSWPDILVEDNVIYVAYTIPLNEDRGIYLTRSDDGGNSWADPVQLFNGEAESWQLVGRPKLARTSNGELHVTWTRDVPTSNSTLALVYARSTDDGQSWSSPETVTEETVIWSDIVGIGTRTVHRSWQALSDSRVLLWHQVSFDSGLTWSQPVRVSNPAMDSGPAALVLGVNDTPHLLQLAQTVEAELFLLEWVWDGARWEPGEELELSETMIGADALSAVRLPENQLGVLYGTLLIDPETADLEDNLIYTSRVLDDAAIESTPIPTLTPTALPTATATAVPTMAPTATVDLNPTPGAGNQANTGSSGGPNGILVGVIPAVIIVGIVFSIGLWWSRRG